MNYIYALRIKLDREVTQRTDLGLYTSGGVSYFRWSELPLAGVADTWLPGVIQNIGPIAKRGNFRTGGGMATAEGFSVTIFNNNQLTLRLAELGISLTGLVCEVLEFVGTDADNDSVEIYPQYTGIIEDVTAWNPLTLTFNVKTARHKRRANLGTLYDDEHIYPIIYGSSDPANGRHFKIPRSTNVNELLKLSDLSGDEASPYPPESYLFPSYNWVSFTGTATSGSPVITGVPNIDVTQMIDVGDVVNVSGRFASLTNHSIVSASYGSPYSTVTLSSNASDSGSITVSLFMPNRLKVRLYRHAYTWPSLVDPNNFIGKYIVVKNGDSSIVGCYRKITAIIINTLYQYGVDSDIEAGFVFTLLDHMATTAKGSYAGDIDENTWVSIYDILMKFKMDPLKCLGFFDSITGLALGDKTEVYGNQNDEIVKLLSYGCEVSAENNELDVNPRLFSGDVSTVNTVHIEPTEGVVPLTSVADLSVYGFPANFEKAYYSSALVPGLYAIYPGTSPVAQKNETGAGNEYDKNSTTYYAYGVSVNSTQHQYYLAFKVKLPGVPQNLKFTKAYLCLKATSSVTKSGGATISTSGFIVKHRGYAGLPTEVINEDGINYSNSVTVENVPDFYYTDGVSTGNKNFYVDSVSSSLLSGYKKFDLQVSGAEEYENIEELVVFFYRYAAGAGVAYDLSDTVRFYEAAIIFENEVGISNEVYV